MKIRIHCKTCGRPFVCDIDKNYKTTNYKATIAIIKCFECGKLTKILHIVEGAIDSKKATRKDLLKFYNNCEKENKEAKCIS